MTMISQECMWHALQTGLGLSGYFLQQLHVDMRLRLLLHCQCRPGVPQAETVFQQVLVTKQTKPDPAGL